MGPLVKVDIIIPLCSTRRYLHTFYYCSDLLGEYEFSVELDYDENMEELDVHCIESPKTDGKIVHSSSQ